MSRERCHGRGAGSGHGTVPVGSGQSPGGVPTLSCPRRDRARNTGVISCTVCLEEFQTPITCILTGTGTPSP